MEKFNVKKIAEKNKLKKKYLGGSQNNKNAYNKLVKADDVVDSGRKNNIVTSQRRLTEEGEIVRPSSRKYANPEDMLREKIGIAIEKNIEEMYDEEGSMELDKEEIRRKAREIMFNRIKEAMESQANKRK